MSDDIDKTIKIQRHAKVGTDSRGRTVWTKPVEDAELELVSTVMLERILDSDDEAEKQRVRALADGEDGVLARDTSNDQFEIISDDEVRAALEAATGDASTSRRADVVLEPAKKSADVEELSLVTTQVLRKMIDPAADELPDGADVDDDAGGYNPYDHG